MSKLAICALLVFTGTAALNAYYDFDREELKVLRDPGGWDYVKMTDSGIQTEHPCFTGKQNPDECSARLILGTDHKFLQETTIRGQAVPRHGTYKLENDQLTFIDELGTPDGPYTVQLDAAQKTLVLFTANVRIELVEHKTLLDKKRKGRK